VELNEITPVEYININRNSRPVYFFKADHHVVAASELLKLTGDYDVECWRPYNMEISEIYSKKIDGITHRVFPARLIMVKYLGKFLWSPVMLDYIRQMVSRQEKFLINMSVGHAWFHVWLMLKLKKIKTSIPVVCLHRSGGFRVFEYNNLPFFKKLYRFHYLIESFLDLSSLRYSDHYFSGSLVEANFLEMKKGISSSFFMEGIDFDKFIPVVDKTALRMELGLPLDKKIMIVTGNFNSKDYGYHHLIRCYNVIKEKVNDLQLIIIGGYKHEDLYEIGIKSGILMIERTHKENLMKYLQASDFYGQPSFDFGFINFGGFGSAMIEALACGLPVISNNILHFPGTGDERKKIGLSHSSPAELIEAIIFMNDNYQSFTETRSIARKYFDINDTRFILLEKYKELANKYWN
jgi:glycosyltransferase involved in cell wall biosynthesis